MNKNLFYSLHSLLLAVLAISLVSSVSAQYEVRFTEEELVDFIHEVGRITGKTFTYDPRHVSGKVTVVSDTLLDEEGVYSLLEATLRVRDLVLIDHDGVVSIVRTQNARPYATDGTGAFDTAHEFVSRVIELQHVSSSEANRVLRPLVSPYGHLLPIVKPNAIVIADHAKNVQNIIRLIREIDTLEAAQLSLVIPMKHALVGDIAVMLQEIYPEVRAAAQSGPGRQITVFANENNNTLFVRGTRTDVGLIADTVGMLDQPYAVVNNTKYFELHHSDAGPMAELLNGIFAQSAPGQSGEGFTGATDITIQADDANNAILVRANPTILSEMQDIITQVDIPKLQVLIEAAIVEITVEDSTSVGFELGAVDERGDDIPLVSTSVNGVISGLLSQVIGSNVQTQDETNSGVGDGVGVSTLANISTPTIATAKIDPDGISFAAIIAALAENKDSNLLSTPYVITMDNQLANFFVGQEVPFRTGTLNLNDQTGQGPVSTIERENVGITLEVTPKIRTDKSVQMSVTNEISAVIAPALGIGEAGFSDIVTTERNITTNVVAQNGQTIVLGGLIRDDVNNTIRRVPGLSRIPLVGRLFRSESATTRKNHLLIFLRPTVIESEDEMESVYQRKMNRIWKVQLDGAHSDEEMPAAEELELYDGRQ